MASVLGYQEPSWVKEPTNTSWSLAEIKGGVEVAVHKLQKATNLIGRAVDMVQIPVHHESCSRLHARLAFDEGGFLWLKDLQSTHGTTVNKRALPKESISKTESQSAITQKGARGVLVFPGDVIRFGASTRIFCVSGPEEYSRGAFQAKQQQAKAGTRATARARAKQAELHQHQQKRQNTMEASPEEAAAAEDENGDEVDSTVDLSDGSSIPARLRKEWERYMAKRQKLDNIQLESDRIQAKGVILTEGQEKQLHRNQERIEKLQVEVQTMENNLLQSMNRSSSQPLHQANEASRFDADEEVEDRTMENRNHDLCIGDGETEESLTRKWKRCQKQLRQMMVVAREKRDRLQQLQSNLQTMGSDHEDAFFVQNDLQVANEDYEKIKMGELRLSRNLDEIERVLLTVSNGKLFMDRSTGHIARDKPTVLMPPPPSTAPPRPKTDSNSASTGASEQASTHPPPPGPPSSFSETTAGQAASKELLEETTTKSMPPPTSRPTSEAHPEPVSKRPRVMGPPLKPATRKGPQMPHSGTIASFLAQESLSAQHRDNQSIESKQPSTGPNFDSKKDEWRAPQDQDGSGVTKLNAKFAGRY